CLEYGKALGMARVHVSVVVARVAPDILRFYQGINEYREMGTLFQFMCSLPLLSYWESRCPACALRVSLQSALEKIGHTRPHLREMLKLAIQEVEPISAESAGRLGLESPRKGSLPTWREARARADYERARRDVEARSALMREFAAGDGGEALAGAVGRGPSDPAFLADNLHPIVYAP